MNTFGSAKEYYHGIESCSIHKGDKLKDLYVEILGLKGQANKISVAYEFMTQMGNVLNVPPKYKLNVVDMLYSCIGIHRTYCETNNCDERYIQVQNLNLCQEGKKLFSKYQVQKCTPQLQTDLMSAG